MLIKGEGDILSQGSISYNSVKKKKNSELWSQVEFDWQPGSFSEVVHEELWKSQNTEAKEPLEVSISDCEPVTVWPISNLHEASGEWKEAIAALIASRWYFNGMEGGDVFSLTQLRKLFRKFPSRYPRVLMQG